MVYFFGLIPVVSGGKVFFEKLRVLLVFGFGWKKTRMNAFLESQFIATYGVWLCIVSVFLVPNIPFPASALLVGVSVVLVPAIGYFPAILVAYVGFGLAAVWGYWLSRWLLSSRVGVIMDKLPKLALLWEKAGGSFLFLVLVRGLPGTPLFAQTWLLGALKVPFGSYMFVTLVFHAVGVVLFFSGVDAVAMVFRGEVPWLPLSMFTGSISFILLSRWWLTKLEVAKLGTSVPIELSGRDKPSDDG